MSQSQEGPDENVYRRQTKERLIAFRDLALVVAMMVAVKQSLLPITQLYAGPASTLSAMILATILLRRRGRSWGDLGFRWPESWSKTLGLTVLTMAFFIVCTQLMVLLADQFFEDIGTSDRFSHIKGDLVAYALIMFLVWTHGSFFEELLFRAFIISNASESLGGGLRGDIIALLISSAFFGYRHAYYQGWHGALVTGAGGFAFGVFYLWFGKRNIMPLILAHGTFNTLGQTFRYLGIED
ncbi:CPBP family intramembrane metalloprotease [Erythrobacter sp. SCSIO 43205]|uniref:CPBP family intramembrane glutamic endopeptidase n=1 Tax=Erythrobacter sp. SCSIO 43205 TaxID=2779361 RepID=UPI001CA7DEA7|nr:type II CAAX endopeptidase family protein [Erythrobacter sp. SCSIO 43205]UAB79008.1 CPBP family intramembrane metalloprotease [Erythrobacter sp. SCSIO 43205]